MKIKLLCIPYAGGSAYAYNFFKDYLKEFEIIPVELKGRGKRFKEANYNTFEEVIDDIYEIIKEEIKDSKYMIFGHSMGSWLAYELYYKIRQEKNTLPMHMFFSGREAPCIKKKDALVYKKTDKAIIETLKDLGGMEEMVLNNNELLELFLPIIKNDFKILSGYSFKERDQKVVVNSTIISGIDDKTVSYRGLYKWISLIEGQVAISKLKGDHFYFNRSKKELCELIQNVERGE